MLPFAWHAATEVDISEHRYPGLREQALAELFGIRGTDHAAGLGNVRPDVEGAARNLTLHARHLVQEPHDQVAPLEEAIAHGARGVLRPVDRLRGRPLADLRGAGVGVRD